ncbi:MAG: hypothetical protein PVG30_05040 [Gammaproteobacteria bacterium]|jgi:tetratricopeptide (TPR) repeat protein
MSYKEGKKHQSQENYDDAIMCYLSDLKVKPKEITILGDLVQCYFAKKDYANVIKYYAQAETLSFKDAEKLLTKDQWLEMSNTIGVKKVKQYRDFSSLAVTAYIRKCFDKKIEIFCETFKTPESREQVFKYFLPKKGSYVDITCIFPRGLPRGGVKGKV